MTKNTWKKRIRKACQEAGTYKPFFEAAIDMLADIMAARDDALEKFAASGKNTVVVHKNKGGASNIVKNPALVVITDLNTQALTFWRDLGLTPAGLKKINDEAMKGQKRSALAEALKDLGA